MIPRRYIDEWRKTAPWPNDYQIEQDLIISRAIIELFSSDHIRENYAFRGGTALHKLYLSPQSRYSEDIDLMQIKPGPIKDTVMLIGRLLSFIEGKRSVRQSANNNTVIYQFDSEIQPVVKMKLKIEINCREHFNVYGLQEFDFNCESSWFDSNAKVTTYYPEELLGTKMRALYQRKKGRDLFDLYYAMEKIQIDPDKVINSFRSYMKAGDVNIPTKKQYLMNLEAKLSDKDFIGDIYSLLRPGVKYDVDEAFQIVKTKLLDKM